MPTLIPADIAEECESYMDDLFDTFARDLEFIVYKSPEETILVLDSNFDSNWDKKEPWSDSSSSFVEVKETFPVRVWFLDYEQQMNSTFLEGKMLEGPKSLRNVQKIKIQVKQDAFDFIRDASRCKILDKFWNISSSEKAVGIFNFKYYIFVLERAD